MSRLIETIGGFAKADKICGYCRCKQACLTDSQVSIHRCANRGDHVCCEAYIPFEYSDECKKNPPLTGEAYRQSLKKKHK